jgi:hypothetical protein
MAVRLGDGPSTAAGLADHLRAGGGSVLAPDLAHLVDADGTPATIDHVATAVATAVLASSRPGATWWLAGHSLGAWSRSPWRSGSKGFAG